MIWSNSRRVSVMESLRTSGTTPRLAETKLPSATPKYILKKWNLMKKHMILNQIGITKIKIDQFLHFSKIKKMYVCNFLIDFYNFWKMKKMIDLDFLILIWIKIIHFCIYFHIFSFNFQFFILFAVGWYNQKVCG